MNLEKKRPLKDFGLIQSCKNYLKIEADKKLKQQKKLVFNKYFVGKEEYCTVGRNVEDGYVCFCENDSSNYIYYFHLILDSFFGRLMLDPDAADHGFKGQVTLKKLRDFPVIIPSNKVLQAAILLDFSIKTVVDLARKDNDKLFLESTKNLMEELRDDFVMELYVNNFFVNHHISIVDSFVDVIKTCEGESLSEIVLHVMRTITDPEGKLLSNMRRFRVLINDFSHQSSI